MQQQELLLYLEPEVYEFLTGFVHIVHCLEFLNNVGVREVLYAAWV